MPQLSSSPWTAALVAAVVTLALVGLLLRYRALDRAGTPLPPGTGGARLIGVTGTVLTRHVPGGTPGVVRVLGDDWQLADDVEVPLAAGDQVVVREVVGTRLVVAPRPPPTPTADDSGADPSTRSN